MLPRTFVCLLAMSLISYCGFAQKFISFPTYNVDSLLLILPDQLAEERVNSLNKLAASLSFVDSDLSWQYVDEAMNLAEELDYKEGIAEAFQNYGYINVYRSNYPKALNNYLQALSCYEKLGEKNRSAWLCSAIASAHYFAGNYAKAIEYSNIALDKYRQRTREGATVGNVRDTMSVLGAIGLYYFLMDSCDKSLKITLDYLKVGKRNNFDRTDMFLYLILAGERFYCAGEKDSAKLYLEKAIAYPDENPSIEALKYRAILFLGRLNLSEGEFDKAISNYKKAFEFYQKKGFLMWATSASNRLGYIHFKNNQIDIAEEYYLQSEKIFNEMLAKNSLHRNDSIKYIVSWGIELYIPFPSGIMKRLMWLQGEHLYYRLYQINEIKGISDNALKYYIAYANSEDTLFTIRHSMELIQLQTMYETERNEEQIKFLSQENFIQVLKLKQSTYFLFGLGGLVILVVLLALVFIRQNKLRHQQQNLLLQQKLFRSQMNPHFIFNSLTSIQNYILDEDAHKASKYLSRFSKLVRNILDSTVEEYIPLEEEISTIENYLELQKIRFQNRFDYTLEVDEAINTENMYIPPMLAQPFIENSIEHGIKHKGSKGNIHIRFTLKNNYLVFEVEDDGVGREKAREILYTQNREHKSLATAITIERIRVLNKKLKKKIMLHILDLMDANNQPSGTKVQIKIPC